MALYAAPSAHADTVVAAAGDIACGPDQAAFNGGFGTFGTNPQCHQRYTSDAIAALAPDLVLAIGDTQYGRADLSAYLGAYDQQEGGTPVSWGRFKAITRPVPGNHEYASKDAATGAYTGAQGYFDYYNGPGAVTGPAGARDKGYYSFDVTVGTRPDGTPARWHLVALNSECADAPEVAAAVGWLGGCAAGSPQERWLRADLAAASAAGTDCTLAYFHHPLFSAAGPSGGDPIVTPLWQALYDYDADIVLNGHHHVYQRFQPLDPAGAPAPGRGIREFVVGTGGRILGAQERPDARLEAFGSTAFGVLALTLRDGGYGWRFVPDGRSGSVTDSGADACVRLHATITSAPAATTGDATPAFAFTASRPAIRFECRVDGGAWSACASPARLPPLPDGPHTFEVRALATDGSPSAPAAHRFTVDTSPPGVSLTWPPPGANLAGTATLRATAADANGVARVAWLLDGVPVATDETAPYARPWNTRRVADGPHRLVAVASDAAGNTARTGAARVHVHNDRTPPSAQLVLPRRPALGRILSRGLRLRARCSEPCRAAAQLRLARSVAHRLGVRPRIGRRGPSGAARRRLELRIPVARRTAARLRAAGGVRIRLLVTVMDRSGNARLVRRSLRLR